MKVEQVLNRVQFHFYEKILICGRPLMTRKAFSAMTKSHAIGLGHYSPNPDVKLACQSLPSLGAIIQKPIFKRSELIYSQDSQGLWIVPWSVKTLLPQYNQIHIAHGKEEALLYCLDQSELSSEIDWFEKENCADSLTYQFLAANDAIAKENHDLSIIRKNLDQQAWPLFYTTVKEWQNSLLSNEIRPEKLDNVFKAFFAPTKKMNLALAYEKVRRAIRMRKLRNYQYLMHMWRSRLELEIFKNLNWNDEQKGWFLKRWENNLFNKSASKSSCPKGRWEQSQAIDRQTAAKFIRYFMDRFIADPNQCKADGEIACILWICIWVSYESLMQIHLYQVIELTTKQLDAQALMLNIETHEIPISYGLCQLLEILKGEGKGERGRRLFEHVSEESLQDAMKKASKAILGDEALHVLPSAFLIFPHLYQGKRMSHKQREALRVRGELSFEPRHTRKELLKELRHSQD